METNIILTSIENIPEFSELNAIIDNYIDSLSLEYIETNYRNKKHLKTHLSAMGLWSSKTDFGQSYLAPMFCIDVENPKYELFVKCFTQWRKNNLES